MCGTNFFLKNSPWEARATRDTKVDTMNIFFKGQWGSPINWFKSMIRVSVGRQGDLGK